MAIEKLKHISLTFSVLFIILLFNFVDCRAGTGLLEIFPGDTVHIQPSLPEPDEAGSALFREKLDSMANSWYIRNLFVSGENRPDFSVQHHYPLSDSLIIARLQKTETAVKLSFNSVVREYIETIVNRRPTLTEILLGLSAYYFPIFEEVFDRHDLPLELKYLSIIESALNPNAVSRVGAVGLWQFMYGTARGLELEITSLIDERRDVLKSTEAAARYMKNLYAIYQDWLLVIAAYNCGPGNVNKAIERTGGKTDYWQIYYALPRETREFVPAYIATTYIMNYYREHKLNPRYPAIALHTDTLIINKKLNLKQVSEVLGIEMESLRMLNPMYRRDIIPGTPEKGYPLRIPVEMVTAFIEKEDSVYNHKKEVYSNNNQAVVNKNEPLSYDPGNLEGKAKIIYTVKEGDNPGYIADWFDISVNELKLWNGISRNLIRTGQKLTVYVPENKTEFYKKINNLSFSAKQELNGHSAPINQTVSATAATATAPAESSGGNYVWYTVKKGDNFWTIAKLFTGVTNTDIMKLNNITDEASLRPGQKLKIKPAN